MVSVEKGEVPKTILVGTPTFYDGLDLADGPDTKLLFLTGTAFTGVLDGAVIYQPMMFDQGVFHKDTDGHWNQVADNFDIASLDS